MTPSLSANKPSVHLRDGVVAEQRGCDARGRCRVLVCGQTVRHQRRGDLVAQVDGLLASKLGVTEAALALQIAVRFPDDGGANKVVAAIGEQTPAPTDVSLSNWTAAAAAWSWPPTTLTLAVSPRNIARTYNLTPGRELLFACRYRLSLQLRGAHVQGRQRLRPPARQLRGRRGRRAAERNCEAAFGAHFQAPGLPNQAAGTVDVYGLQILDATDTETRLLLKHEFLDGGADDVTLATLYKGHHIRQFSGALWRATP